MGESHKIRDRISKYTVGNGLDLGCNDSKIKPNCVGIDLTWTPDANLVGDARDLFWFKDGVFLWVFASHILEDLKDTEKALREWLRVIVKNGYLIIYMPDERWYPKVGTPLANKGHLRDWRAEDVMEIMDKIGLAKLIHKEDCPPPGGIYNHERRQEMEYSFLLIYQKL